MVSQLRVKMCRINMEVEYGIRTVHRAPHKIYSELVCKRNALPGHRCAAVCRNAILPSNRPKS